MIDALERAFAEIHNSIPKGILDIAFQTNDYMDVSLDERIKSEVILKRVRKDISVVAGPMFDLILQSNWAKFTSSPSVYALGISGAYSAYKIPPEAREHRDISCVVNVRFPYTIMNSSVGAFYSDCSIKGNNLAGLSSSALSSQTGAHMLANPVGRILPGNVIILEPPQYNFVPWRCTVRLEFDDNFSGMDVSSIQQFCHLCKYAVQAYIYTNMIIDVESNVVFRGASIGVIKDIISDYRDANDKYQETMLQFQGASMYDPMRLKSLLQRCVPTK